ncbi:MAG: hypothetical protein JXA13_12805 [Anaerolineales bacterium]|nr:hypothetical protein [Anaerolineales bacterium]
MSQCATDKFRSLVQWYLLLTIIETLIALIVQLAIPTDPRYTNTIGYSPTRLILTAGMLLLTASGVWLFIHARKDSPWFRRLITLLYRYTSLFLTLLVSIALLYIYLVCGSYLYFLYWNIPAFTQKAIPFAAFGAAQSIQVTVFLAWVSVEKNKHPIIATTPHPSNKTDEPPAPSVARLSPDQVLTLLLGLIAVIVSAHLSTHFLREAVWDLEIQDYASIQKFHLLFNLDREKNVPSYFSGLDLLLAAVILGVISWHKRQTKDPYWIQWLLLSLGFVYLSLDEVFMLHEKISLETRSLVNPSGVFHYFPWLVVGIPAVVILGVYYFHFLSSLPCRTQILLAAAAAVFLTGAIIMEMMGGLYALNFGISKSMRFALYTIEETLEMLGVAVFIYGLLDYRQQNRSDKQKILKKP